MATERWYLSRRGGSFTPSGYRGDWIDTSAVSDTSRLTLFKETPSDYRPAPNPGVGNNAAVWRCVSEPLGRDRQFFGFHTCELGIGIEDDTHHPTTRLCVWVTQGNTSTPRGILVPDTNVGSSWPTVLGGQVTTGIACEGVSALAGDRIVVELGVHDARGSIYIGGEINQDIVNGGPVFPQGNAQCAWIEFYQEVPLNTPTPIGARYARTEGATTTSSNYYEVPIGNDFTSTVYVLFATSHGDTVTPTAVSVGGISGTKLFDQNTVYLRHSVWRIDGVPAGPAIVATSTSGVCNHYVVAYTIANPPPVGTETFYATGALSGATVSLTASSTIGGLMIDHVINNINAPLTYTPGPGQARDIDYRTNANFHQASSTKVAAASTSNMSWTFSNGAEPWSILGLGLKPSAPVSSCRDDGRAWWFDDFDSRVSLTPTYGVGGTLVLDPTGGVFGTPGVGGSGLLSRLIAPTSPAFSISFRHRLTSGGGSTDTGGDPGGDPGGGTGGGGTGGTGGGSDEPPIPPDLDDPNTYFVSLGGDDSNPGTEVSPWGTLTYALAQLGPGDTLVVRGGIWNEYINNGIGAGTGWSDAQRIRIVNYPGETVWLRPAAGQPWIIYMDAQQQYIEFDGINLDTTQATSAARMGGLALDSNSPYLVNHIRFQNATILCNRIPGDLLTSRIGVDFNGTGASNGSNELINVRVYGSGGSNSMYGAYIHSSNNLIHRCEFYDLGYQAFQIYDGTTISSGNVITRCKFHDINTSFDTRRTGVIIQGNNTIFANNLIYNINVDGAGISAAALSIFHGNGNKIYNNTIYNVRGYAITLNDATNTEVKNNITYSCDVEGVAPGPDTGTVYDSNLFGVNPLFVNPVGSDFRLLSGSPAIDTGATLGDITIDIVGTTRPQGATYDIGAYEFIPD